MRLKRIDVIRVLAIYLVVWAHCQFFDGIKAESPLAQAGEFGVIMLVRFSMQFFFLISGYFLGGRIVDTPDQAPAIAWKYIKKLLIIFIFWWVVYALENPQHFIRLVEKSPVTLLFEGTRIHLWFLVSLSLTVGLFALWRLNKKGYSFLGLGIAFYIIGLLGGSYLTTPVGINIHFNTRDAVFFSTLFFAIGVLFHIHKPKVSPALAWGLYLGGLAWFSLETIFLWINWSLLPIRHDYLVGSIPYGLGAFLIALNAKRETKLDTVLEPSSKYVLGIYVSHLLFLDLWKPLGALIHPIIWFFVMPMLVFGSSLLAVMALSKTPLRRFVM